MENDNLEELKDEYYFELSRYDTLVNLATKMGNKNPYENFMIKDSFNRVQELKKKIKELENNKSEN